MKIVVCHTRRYGGVTSFLLNLITNYEFTHLNKMYCYFKKYRFFLNLISTFIKTNVLGGTI